MNHIQKLINEMIAYLTGDAKRIHHLLKVYSFAKLIGEYENIDSETQNIIEVAAVTHDIGIKVCEEKYHTSSGKYQEIMGPPVARELLTRLGYDNQLIERVCYIVGHHHTFDNIEGLDYQIIVEADFLVNIYDDGLSVDAIKEIKSKIFKQISCQFYSDSSLLLGYCWLILYGKIEIVQKFNTSFSFKYF
jgi:HD superfamily phosphodiesterase